MTQTQDPAGQQTAFLFDKLGQLTRTTEDSGMGGIARYTDHNYDRAGRLTRLTAYKSGTSDPQNTDYAYNKLGVQTRVTYPDDAPGTSRGYVVYSYDAALRLTHINHQDNTDTDVAYDYMGRRLTITKGSEIDSFAYAASGVVTLAQRGVTGNLDAISKVDRSYDGLLRLTREAQTVKEGATRNVDYAYDKGANVLTLTYPSGIAIQSNYDGLGRASTIKRDGSQLVNYSYVGYRPKTQTFETGTNDVTLTMTYDGMARMTRMQYAQTGNTSLPDYSYSFDAASDITRKTFNNLPGAPNEDYQYDTLNRLTRTTFGQRASTPYKGYIYDNQSNHLTQDDNGTTIAGLFNAVNEQTKRGAPGSETDVLYDARGNLTKDDTGKSYFYDRQNFLTRVEDNASSRIASYAYDALNRRIEKDVASSGVSRFCWDDDWRLLEETDDAGTPDVKRYYVSAPGIGSYVDDQLCFVDSTGGSDVTYSPCHNHNFSIVAMLNTSGGVVERYDYNPYGERIVLDPDYANDADGISDLFNPIGHQGLFHDVETGLIYNRARMFNPVLGRFMQPDPLIYFDGMNFYEYVGSLPTCHVDPNGEFWSIVATVIFAAADTYEYRTGRIGGKEYAARMAVNVASLAADVATGGMGGGLAVRATAMAVRGTQAVAKVTRTTQAVTKVAQGVAKVNRGVQAVKTTVEATKAGRAALTLAKAGDKALNAADVAIGGSDVYRGLVDGDCDGNTDWDRVLYGLGRMADGADGLRGRAPRNGHHSDPKFMGGDPKQDLTNMAEYRHQQLHSDLNDHLAGYTDAQGNHMRPQRNNSGRNIRSNFNTDQRLGAMSDFYNNNMIQYPDAAYDFFNQHPELK